MGITKFFNWEQTLKKHTFARKQGDHFSRENPSFQHTLGNKTFKNLGFTD
jgi:hypothetical protein